MHDKFQWYPTNEVLAAKVWKLIPDTAHIVLDPSAGRGDLIPTSVLKSRRVQVHCMELDVRHHPQLRERGFKVVGTDFLEAKCLAQYSAIVLNPPFAQGAQHVLHAWHGLFDGCVVAILNAETLRNPCNQQREHLLEIVKSHGQVEFIENAFSDSERPTDVEIALIKLEKRADLGTLVKQWTEGLEAAPDALADVEPIQQITLPRAEIQNLVLAYNAGATSAQNLILAEQQHIYYSSLLGQTLGEMSGNRSLPIKHLPDALQNRLNTMVEDLRDRAWSAVMNRTDFSKRLSSGAQKRLQAEFDLIKQLDFTTSNVYSFIGGVLASRTQIQIDMACDVFDLITRYHSKNRVWYRGWKSNDRHRTAGMRVTTKRFVIPFRPNYETKRMLGDFDKVFAMLSGVYEPQTRLESIFDGAAKSDLHQSRRVATDYFDIRYYPGIGTLHFFPRDQALMDTLNRAVGKHREWLPPAEEMHEASPAFWEQFEHAERYAKDVTMTRDTVWGVMNKSNEGHASSQRALDAALEAAHERAGLTGVFDRLGADRPRLAA